MFAPVRLLVVLLWIGPFATGADAADSAEPLYLQDHQNPVLVRNIWALKR